MVQNLIQKVTFDLSADAYSALQIPALPFVAINKKKWTWHKKSYSQYVYHKKFLLKEEKLSVTFIFCVCIPVHLENIRPDKKWLFDDMLSCWGVSLKLRQLGFPNQIVDDSDSKPSKLDYRLRSDSDSNDDFVSMIAISI